MAFSGKPSQVENLERTEQLWQSAAQTRSVPYRGDLSTLNSDYQFLLQKDEAGGARIRLAGLYFEALFGASLAGREFASIFNRGQSDIIREDLEQVFHDPAKAYISTFAERLFVDFALLPVSSDSGPVEYVLGAVNLQEIPLKNITTLQIQSVEKVSLVEARTELKYGFAEEKASFGGAPRSRFRIIEGGGQTEATPRPGLKVVEHVKREP